MIINNKKNLTLDIEKLNDTFFDVDGLNIKNIISKGSTSIVYYGIYNNMEVAIKYFNNQICFKVEEKIAKDVLKLNLPVISPIKILENNNIIIYELCEKTLNDSIKDGDEWISNEKKVIKLFYKLFNDLVVLHNLGFSHKDIKPSNILLSKDGNNYIPILGDIGLMDNLNYLSPVGTKLFMPPEFQDFALINSKKDLYKHDVWALSLTSLLTINYLSNMINNNEIINLTKHIKKVDIQNYIPDQHKNFCNAIKYGLLHSSSKRFSAKKISIMLEKILDK